MLEAENGEQALMLLRQYRVSVAAILLDLVMPVKDGYEVLEEMRREGILYHAPAVVITADDSTGNRVKVFELGASDIIAKPFEPEVVKSRVKNIIELGRYRRRLEVLVEEQSARARDADTAVIDMLSSVIEYRSLESGQHIRRIRMFTKILLEAVAENYQEYALDGRRIRLITDASSMHDIGKIAIPDSILNKPGRLTPEEFEVMKTHTLKGCEILSGLDRLQDREYLQYAYQICRYHHERWDGRGYPDGLKGNSIPICAQVVAIADCYDALTTDRVYKKAIAPSRAFSMILNGECGTFSPRLLECFKNVRDAFAGLSEEYADGLAAELIRDPLPDPELPLWNCEESTLEQSQLKYFALLRYLDSTVLEIDLTTGVYHLVYLENQAFSSLRSGGSFEEALRNFARISVHPEDQEDLLKLADEYVNELFEEGKTWWERRFRIFDRKTDSYLWFRASLIRTDLDHPRARKLLLIWRREGLAVEDGARLTDSKEQNVAVVARLLGGIQKYLCDSYFSLVRVSRGLIELVGYSETEIESQFHNRLIELVYPADREKMGKQFREQRKAGRTLELEYRLTARDGRIVWVSDRVIIVREDGVEVAYSVIMDVTEQRRAEEELRLSLERHDIIMGQTNDIIFEWDIAKDELFLSSNWEKQYGYTPITKNLREEIIRVSHIHPNEIPIFIELMDAVSAGVPYKEIEFRILDKEGRYRWRRVRATAQFDMDGKPFKAVGVLLDIDSQKRANAELADRAARDGLTSLYNKAAAQSRIDDYLSNCVPDTLSALLILDVDNFKLINDQFGHMFGDAVLAEIAVRISGLFRGEDTVSRIGGDEFLIFMPDVRRKEIAEQRGKEMLTTIQDMLRENLEDVPLTCSIGAAFASGCRVSFQELFECADRALYKAKAAGKNNFVCYTEQMKQGVFGTAANNDRNVRTVIDYNSLEKWSISNLTARVFDILFDAEEFDMAVQSILQLIGEIFGISRIYIFENSGDGTLSDNTFEWCAEGIDPQIQNLKRISYYNDGHDYRDNFGSDGLFYCKNVRKLKGWERRLLEQQGILSTLQYAIRENGVFKGFVGFDDCKICRLWTKEQIDALTFLGKLLSVFLLKNRAQESLSESLENLHSVLDHQEVWLYVLDPDTFTLRYINGRTKELVPEAQVGRPCYEVFYRRERPCENCVLKRARESGRSTMEIYNPYLKLWVLADASIVEWNRRKACLIGCRDISVYMQRGDTSGKPSERRSLPYARIGNEKRYGLEER